MAGPPATARDWEAAHLRAVIAGLVLVPASLGLAVMALVAVERPLRDRPLAWSTAIAPWALALLCAIPIGAGLGRTVRSRRALRAARAALAAVVAVLLAVALGTAGWRRAIEQRLRREADALERVQRLQALDYCAVQALMRSTRSKWARRADDEGVYDIRVTSMADATLHVEVRIIADATLAPYEFWTSPPPAPCPP